MYIICALEGHGHILQYRIDHQPAPSGHPYGTQRPYERPRRPTQFTRIAIVAIDILLNLGNNKIITVMGRVISEIKELLCHWNTYITTILAMETIFMYE